MAANAFTLFGTLNIDAKRFQSALREADKNLKTTASSLDAFEKRLTTTGNIASHIAHQLDKVASALNRIKSAAGGVKGLTITLQGVGGAAASASNAVSKIGAATQKASIDTSKLQAVVDSLEAGFKGLSAGISGYAGRVGGAGKMTATAGRQIDKLYEALRKQRDALLKVVDAYTSGQMSAQKFASSLDKIQTATAKLTSKLADANAKLNDSVAKEKAATAAKQQAAAAASAKRAALERQRAADQAAREAARQSAASERQQAAAIKATAAAAKAKGAAMSQMAAKVRSAGSAIKGLGTDMTYLVSVPMVAFGAYAFKSATAMDALRNKLTAATGSVDAANAKLSHFQELAKTAPGVFADGASSLYASFKPMGLSDNGIDEIVRAFGRLKTAEENFDFDQFRYNMAQMFNQKFEMQDMKQALTFFPRFTELLSKQMGLTTKDLDTLQAALKEAQDRGIISFTEFSKLIADAVNNDPVLKSLQETLGNRFAKMFDQVAKAVAPIGKVLADVLMPPLEALAALMITLSAKFQALSPATQQLIIGIGLAVAGLGAFLIVAGSVIGVIGVLAQGIIGLVGIIGGKAVLTGALTKAGTAILAFGKTLYGVFSFATLKSIGAAIWAFGAKIVGVFSAAGLKSIIATLGAVGKAIISAFSVAGLKAAGAGILAFGKILLTAFLIPAAKIILIVGLIIGVIYGLYKAFQTNFGNIRTLVTKVMDRISASISDGVGAISIWWDEVKKAASGLESTWSAIFNFLEPIFSGIFTTASEVFIGIWEIISSAFKGIWQIVSSIVLFLIKLLSGDLTGAMYELANVVIGVINTLIGVIGGGVRAMISPIMGLLEAMAGYLPAGMAQTATSIKNSLDSALTTLNDGVPLFNRIGFNSGAAYGSGIAAGMKPTGGGGEGEKSEFQKMIEKFSADFEKNFKKGGGGKGARGAGKATAQDFFEGFIEAVNMLKASANASLAQFFDIKQLRSGLKGKAGQAVVDFLKPIVDEMAKLPDTATYLDQFNQKFAELAKSADPEMRKSFEAVIAFLKEAQKQKDSAKAIEATGSALEQLKEKLKDLEGQLALPKSTTDATLEFLDEFAKKHGELDPVIQELIMYKARLIDGKVATEAANEAILAFAQGQVEANSELEAFANINAKGLTHTQQLESFLLRATLANYKFSESALAAARAGATQADALTKIEENMSLLGIDIQASINQFDLLKATLADTTGLETLAAKLKMNVDELKRIIVESYNAKAALGDLVKFNGVDVQKLSPMEQVMTGLRQKMKALADETPTFTESIVNTFDKAITGIGDVFAEAVSNWDGTLKGFWTSLVQGFRQLVSQIVAELMKMLVMRAVFSLLGMIPGLNFPMPKAADGGIVKAASGGLIKGAGTGTSDSIPAMLSNGEYVIPARVVKQYGTGFFESLRAMRNQPTMAYSQGGLVGAASSAPSQPLNTSNVININVSGNDNNPQQTAMMIQREVLNALKKTERRNR